MIAFMAWSCRQKSDSDEMDRPNEVIVSEFGAVPDDGKDDTGAIRDAIDACSDAPGTALIFPRGVYDIGDENAEREPGKTATFRIKEKNGLTIEGNGATLVGHTETGLMLIENCRGITFRNLKVDWDPLPFTAGRIVARGDDYIDVKVNEQHEARAGLLVGAILDYDPQKGHLAYRGIDEYQREFYRETEVVGPGIMRMYMKARFPRTDYIVARHATYGGNGFTFFHCDSIRFEDVDIYCVPGMGIRGTDCTDITLVRLRVMIRPGSGRWMSTTADASHFPQCRGTIRFEDCLFEGHGDDASNIRAGHYYTVLGRTGPRSVSLIEFGKRESQGIPLGLRVGDTLELGGGEDPLIPYATGTVASLERDEVNNIAHVTFTEDLPERAGMGTLIGNPSSGPSLVIRNCTMRNHRSRGFLLKTRNVLVEDNLFENVSGSALLIRCENNYWWEMISARNVMVRNNRFVNCNFGAVRRQAVITITAQTKSWYMASAGVHKGITITGNTFERADGSAIHAEAAGDLVITGNRFIDPTDQAISLRNCRDVTIMDNELTGDAEGLVIQYGVDHASLNVENNQGF
jgi:hypothetical protein